MNAVSNIRTRPKTIIKNDEDYKVISTQTTLTFVIFFA